MCPARQLGSQDHSDSGGLRGGGLGSFMVLGLEHVHPRSVMDWVWGVQMS
jgi:hypothetical protein